MDSRVILIYEMLAGLIPLALVSVILKNKIYKNGKSGSMYKKLCVVIFSIYIVCVYHLTDTGTLFDILKYHFTHIQDSLNLTPFPYYINEFTHFLNILLFVPFGFLVPMIWKKMNNIFYVFGSGLLLSVLIEASQLLNLRITDVDDLIMNVGGALAGFIIFNIFNFITKSKFQIKKSYVKELFIIIIVILMGRFFFYDESLFASLFL